jgi:glycosyltransferase involved in cell wall biosynthesis
MNVTVCITSFNQRDYLIEAIESVLGQTLRPTEIVIVDDASTDGSVAVITGYAARYPELIRPILKPHNRGVVDTFNLGLDAARGDFIAFLAGDDRWLPAKLEKEAGRLAEPDRPDGVYADYYFSGPGGERLYLWAGERRPPQGDILPQVLARDFPRRALFRSELANLRLWRQVGRFDPAFTLYEDWDAHIRLAARLRYAYVAEPLSEYRRHSAGQSMASVEKHLAATDRIERKYADLTRSLEPTHGAYLRRSLAGWRAHLWRSAARDVARRRPPGFRAEALRRFRHSLSYEPKPDFRLLWYLLRPAAGV